MWASPATPSPVSSRMPRLGVLLKWWPALRLTAMMLLMIAARLAFAEHALENRVDVLEVITEVELLGYLGDGEIFLPLGVLLQQRLEIALAAPHRHRVALHELVGVLAAAAFLRQRNQKPLRMNEAAEPVEILLHVLGVDQQLVD